MTNYSFIIPHHNSPELLNNLLTTIPQREDIEIIVVDDNSDGDKKAQSARTDVQIVYISDEETKGAGHARNVGLFLAKGKWLLFADSDDFYEKDFIDKLDKYVESDNDIVFFSAHVMYEPLHPEASQGINYIERIYRRYENSDKSDYEFHRMTMMTSVPWNKMFKHRFISDINAQFECVPLGNDAWFSKYTGSKARKVAIINERLYYYIRYSNNTTFKKRPFIDYYIITDSSIHRHILLKQYNLLDAIPIWGFYPKNVKRDYGIIGLSKLVIYTIFHDPTFFDIISSKLKRKLGKRIQSFILRRI